jgi:hypothetical protein
MYLRAKCHSTLHYPRPSVPAPPSLACSPPSNMTPSHQSHSIAPNCASAHPQLRSTPRSSIPQPPLASAPSFVDAAAGISGDAGDGSCRGPRSASSSVSGVHQPFSPASSGDGRVSASRWQMYVYTSLFCPWMPHRAVVGGDTSFLGSSPIFADDGAGEGDAGGGGGDDDD